MLGFAENFVLRLAGTLLAKGIHPRRVARAKQRSKQKYMSTLTVKGNWNISKGRLKQTMARLTHDNLQLVEGKMDELVGRIQKRKAQSRKRLERLANDAEEFGGHQ